MPLEGAPLVVATYNVHGFVGYDGVRDLERSIRVLEEIDPDVVALQEVVAPLREEAVGAIAQRLGAEPVLGPTLEHETGSFGNLLLSRIPVRRVHRLDLSVAGREPRGALDCLLEAGPTPLRVVATHLGLRARERRHQVEALLAALGRSGPDVLLLLGDMNDWRVRTGPLAPLRRRFGNLPRPRTFPAWRPAFALDRMWARPRALLRGVRTHRSRLARQASDHLPLCAELLLEKPHAPSF